MAKPKLRNAVTRVWLYNENQEFLYPEDDPAFSDFFEGKEIGLVFSGGGARAATCAIGQLRGLQDIGLLEKAKYIASNSGGTWGTLPYIYFKGDLNDFFGPYFPPGMLTEEVIQNVPEGAFIENLTKAGALVGTLIQRYLFGKGDESFSHAIGKIFMERHNIDYKNKLFTLNKKSFEEIKENNPALEKRNFEFVGAGRPFHIANGTLHNWKLPDLIKNKFEVKGRAFHIEMTPLYCGVKVFHRKEGDKNSNLGGGYVEPFAFDSRFDKKLPKQGDIPLVKVKLKGKKFKDYFLRFLGNFSSAAESVFTLSDVMGTSGSALSIADEGKDVAGKRIFKLIIPKLTTIVSSFLNSLPAFYHWSPQSITKSTSNTYVYNMGDGGPVDDIGLMPLLARGVEKIICFCNVQYKVIDRKSGEFDFSKMDSDVLGYFGLGKDLRPIDQHFRKVFDTSDHELMCQSFQEAFSNGDPLVHEGEHRVLENSYFGIKGGKTVKIFWIYNDRSKNWENEIKGDFGEKIRGRIGSSGGLRNFPNFKTFGENFLKVIDMKTEQATLLSNYTTWVVKHNEEKIKRFFDIELDE